MKRIFIAFNCIFLSVLTSADLLADEGRLAVIYPKPASNSDIRDQYFYELLTLALEKSAQKYGAYQLRNGDFVIPSSRIPKEVRKGKYLNIMTSPDSTELSESMLAIPIPLVKGIQGIRLMLVKNNQVDRLAKINDFVELKTLNFGQGAGWLDKLIFEDAGLLVTPVTDYNSLFKMLNAERFDAFPRGINEIYREHRLLSQEYPEMKVDNALLIYYDLPVYFFVAKDNQGLKERIEFGLIKAINDGSFDRLFNQYFGVAIKQANLEKRKLFHLNNPFVSKINKNHNKKYWLPFILKNFDHNHLTAEQ
ncbi:amino acid ABC transporter substrate-binding protein [Aliikangiella marina]|uniref:Amino acid ABC transporter substrate-binding protein n=1 Tax=Aliikangiella marina TaxID=1712262 RepID=A0A545T6T1_9GAMM|nr:transporter substrate-binding domain-containing protein [Aliikangiella marina]TQV72931.1 amino acid ABC transporter substrate-binding protein [Aliikangiella marina]